MFKNGYSTGQESLSLETFICILEQELQDLIDRIRPSVGCECDQCESQKKRFKVFLVMVPGMYTYNGRYDCIFINSEQFCNPFT